MQGAYRDLCDGDPALGSTVAAIAARWGFTNPRTFAVAYTLSTGGETPTTRCAANPLPTGNAADLSASTDDVRPDRLGPATRSPRAAPVRTAG